ncbi:MAG: DUF1588 domain-containing protein [Planctomycetota bacterium]|nr:MAG: DUF1588 domain-containing protein [Planctomycetota bacterium]
MQSMKREPVELFAAILSADGSVFELLDAPAVWVDGRLAELYGIPGVTGDVFRRVVLADRRRGGVLGMAAVLAATSAPNRTSPVVRGAWVLQTLLGQKLPEPPPDAGALPPDAGTKPGVTLREELQRHRREQRCAVCHDKIDPIGFGLENFDAIGRWRTEENGKPIDASGRLPDGTTFDGPAGLKDYLLASGRAAFVRTLTRRLLAYAVGRKLQYFDTPVVDEITSRVLQDGGRARRLFEEIVLSRPFLWQEADEPSGTHTAAPGAD